MPEKEPCMRGEAIGELLMTDKNKLVELLKSLNVALFAYTAADDTFFSYNQNLALRWKSEGYLANLSQQSHIWADDLPKMRTLLLEGSLTPTELRIVDKAGELEYYLFTVVSAPEDPHSGTPLVGTVKNITSEKKSELLLREKAYRDPLTMLYNRDYGQKLVNEYLYHKGPFVSCALLVIDIDFFKQVNDTYGHLFGDKVLLAVAKMLQSTFAPDDVVIRAGGDEFSVFIKSITYTSLIHKTSLLLENARSLTFGENPCRITCSVGVCSLPENTFGYTYQQLFGDADWALYRAKSFGRDRYEFCDNLQRFETVQQMEGRHLEGDIDERYLRNDVISTAFEIFEKMPNFDAAIHLLLKVVGVRLQLDRITVIRTDTRERKTSRSYLWTAPNVPEVLPVDASFTKEDFLTLFHSYDAYGTTVLDYDDMGMYSPGAQALLMQGEAKTVVYAAMYFEGHYAGAVSYVTCDAKRHWSQSQRCQLGELTKIISAHMAKSQALNYATCAPYSAPDIDSLTGLMNFSRFREEVERIIVGKPDEEYMMTYTDFVDFKYFNHKYGYQQGDHLLKRFASHLAKAIPPDTIAYFSRVVADQFVLFMPLHDKKEDLLRITQEINESFVQKYSAKYPAAELCLRTGIYCIEPDCPGASAAIDAANLARRQVSAQSELSACLYSKKFERAHLLEDDIITRLPEALKNHEFKVYLQPKVSLADGSFVGAEALVRWQRPDGSALMMPGDFVPVYERSGRILELDFYVFEQVAAFLAKNERLGRRQLPISINASILHTTGKNTVQRYRDILKKYNIDPSLTEIELTETPAAAEYEGVARLFRQLQNVGMLTSLNDFGGGSSSLNHVLDIPVSIIKIDRAFLNACEGSEKGKYFLKQIIALVKGLGYHVLCEGIETQAQLDLLREAGCEMGQGFFFSRPIPIEEYEALVYGAES